MTIYASKWANTFFQKLCFGTMFFLFLLPSLPLSYKTNTYLEKVSRRSWVFHRSSKLQCANSNLSSFKNPPQNLSCKIGKKHPQRGHISSEPTIHLFRCYAKMLVSGFGYDFQNYRRFTKWAPKTTVVSSGPPISPLKKT